MINKTENEINLMELFIRILKYKNVFKYCVGVCFLIGYLVSILSPKMYTASSVFIYKGSSQRGENLPFFMNQSSSNSDIIPVSLYPSIMNSVTFQKEMINTPLRFSFKETPITYQEYYTKYPPVNRVDVLKKYTILLPFTLFDAVKNIFKKKESSKTIENSNDNLSEIKGLYSLSPTQSSLFSKLSSQLSLTTDEKNNTITISCSMPEAVAAAQMTEKAQQLLQKLITDYRTAQLKEQLEFIEQQYNNSKAIFEEKQYVLASYQDKNRALITNLSQTHLEKLKSEYNLAFSIFSDFAKQLESKKIQIQEGSLSFVSIDPVIIPQYPSHPNRSKIISQWVLAGIIIAIGYIVFNELRKSYKRYKNNLNN